MSREAAGVVLAANHAEKAFGRARDAEPRTEERLGAVIEAVWWLVAGWEAAGKPSGEADEILQGFSWIRTRSIHDVDMLVRGYGGYSDGYGGSPPPVTKTVDLYSDEYVEEHRLTEVWGSVDEIKSSLTKDEWKTEANRVARGFYDTHLSGSPIHETIELALTRLRVSDAITLGDSDG